MYEHSLTIPANTAKTDYITETITLNWGIIEKIELVFPSGCAAPGAGYLVGIRFSKYKVQIWPNTGGTWYHGNNASIIFHPYRPLVKSPFSLDIDGYNIDDTYDHEILIRINIIPVWAAYMNSKAYWRDYSRWTQK